tara:strand:- start:9064 stop:10740 length:1677 start_codon:yes stop_codon:yes gene_type:complete
MRTKDSYNKRLKNLDSERSGFIDYWRELSDNILSSRGRFLTSDRNKGHKRNTKQFNNSARLAVRTLASGMMAGITSPARPWFRLQTPDPKLNEVGAVKEWLNDVEVLMREVYSQSNVYNTLHTVYSELAVFGTATMGIYEDYENVLWCKQYTAGSYLLAMNGRSAVDTLYREYELTVAQLVTEFGIENVSQSVKGQFETGNTEAWHKVVHAIELNDGRDNTNPLAKHKKYRSVYYEADSDKENKTSFLRESGYNEFPILAPRWDVTGEDVYATDCPAMTALGDVKALQLLERRKYQAVDKITNPPMQAPSNLKAQVEGQGMVAGDIVYVDDTSAGGIRSLYDYRPDLNAIQAMIQETENRIDKAFYVDLFLMLANSDRKQITAREISERHEEKLLMLGPVLERLHTELLDPLIDRTFAMMQRAGILPEPPEELRDTELRIEYVSVLAQAQRLVAVGAIERTAQFVGELSAVFPNARHKFDAEQAIDEYGAALGLSPRVIRSDEAVAEIIAQEQQAMAQQQQAEQMAQMGQVAQQASQTDTSGKNALTDMMKMAGMNNG